MSKFNNNPSAAYLKAVAVLKALPFNQRGSAFADATALEMSAKADTQVGKVVKRGSWEKVASVKNGGQLPADDHGELRCGKALRYTSHPYSLTLNEMRDIVALCERLKLSLVVDARSWYYPGGTLRMTYRMARSKDS